MFVQSMRCLGAKNYTKNSCNSYRICYPVKYEVSDLRGISMGTKRAAIYARVSTSGQTTANQVRELRAVARRSEWTVVKIYKDDGISGAHGSDKRPAFRQLLDDATAKNFDLIAAWSVDRLGRSLRNLVEFLGDIHAKGIDLYLHQQRLDTSTPTGKAMFQLCGVFAEFERAIIQERVRAGISRARATGKKSWGRPRVSAAIERKVRTLRRRDAKKGIMRIAREAGCGVGTAQRILTTLKPSA